jgi:hypothetical protein
VPAEHGQLATCQITYDRSCPELVPPLIRLFWWLNVIADKLNVTSDLGAILQPLKGEKAFVDEQIRVRDLTSRLEAVL